MILKSDKFNEIVEFLSNYKGLPIECEEDLIRHFPDIPVTTLRSINSKIGQNSIKSFYSRNYSKTSLILKEYEKRIKNEKTILQMSLDLKVPPLSICRMILNEKYSKNDVKEMLKDPNLIPDPLLSANCFMCIFNDNQDGPLIDMIRYSVGEEYEVKLKELARRAGLTFYDENNLRRDGYDKTPDLLLAIPCIYRNTIINWIESKASFGDVESHSKYYKDQLSCYTNRFNTGIVIYWFGFHEEILTTTKNLIILDDFPCASEFQKLEFKLEFNKKS